MMEETTILILVKASDKGSITIEYKGSTSQSQMITNKLGKQVIGNP